MDKLEKAMQKARAMRTAQTAAAHAPAHDAPYARGPVVSPRGDLVPITQEQLEGSRIVSSRTRNPQADIFRLLRAQVLQIMAEKGFKTLAVTSPSYGDGKTTVALNLALSIAQEPKQTVLLADLDLRKPNLHEFLGIAPEAGLSDYLLHGTPLPSCLLRLSFERLSILPAGEPVDESSEALGLPKMATLAKEMKTRYADRIVVYDMPPVLEQDDSLSFVPHVDAVLLVLREGKTKAPEVSRCLELLAGANIIGIVLNEAL